MAGKEAARNQRPMVGDRRDGPHPVLVRHLVRKESLHMERPTTPSPITAPETAGHGQRQEVKEERRDDRRDDTQDRREDKRDEKQDRREDRRDN
jgi:hypothetical protein